MPLVRRLTAAFVLVATACWPGPIAAQSPGEPHRAEFRTIDGTRMTLEALRGKVVLLDFWATWCAPCLVELPRLRRLHDELGNASLVIVGVSLDTTEPRRLASWTRRNNIGWPQVHDGRGYNGALARQFGVEELPATLLFDRDGRLAARDLRGVRLEATIRALLAGVGRD
ncbi:MAG: TlpA family protein disulfide reductase [Acidobacteriota bacterium]|nr:TlpA family protein disulfide reductase [Acidobacteriota bacterium]